MQKKGSSFVGITLILIILFTFAFPYTVHAESPYKYHRYPGPWEYEEDIVTVACAQLYPRCDSSVQLEKMKSYVTRAADKETNILLFPETPCWVIPNMEAAELLPGPTSREMEKLAKQYDMYIVYGFEEQDKSDPSELYNSAAIIGPEGFIGVYRKTGVHFTGWQKGYEPFIFDTSWGPIGVSICYDTYMIPELARTYAMNGCRLILNPTATPSVGGAKYMMASALQSRVWEDALFIASANLVGPSENLEYFGNSTIIGVPENLLEEPKYYAGPASNTDEELIVATINLGASDRMREFTATFQTNPFLGEPDFLPDIWANLYGTHATPSVDAQMETTNEELETLRKDYQKALQTAAAAKQTTLVTSIIAGTLLLGIIALGIVAFRKKG